MDGKNIYMLKYQKTIVRLKEFNVEKANFPKFPLDYNELSLTTIYFYEKAF